MPKPGSRARRRSNWPVLCVTTGAAIDTTRPRPTLQPNPDAPNLRRKLLVHINNSDHPFKADDEAAGGRKKAKDRQRPRHSPPEKDHDDSEDCDGNRGPHATNQIAGEAARKSADQPADLEDYRHDKRAGGRIKLVLFDDVGRDVEGHRVERISQRYKNQKAASTRRRKRGSCDASNMPTRRLLVRRSSESTALKRGDFSRRKRMARMIKAGTSENA